MVRDYVEIGEVSSLAELIERLNEVRDAIPAGAGPDQVRFRGDDLFGRHLLVTYLRPETPEELAVAARASEFADRWRGRNPAQIRLCAAA
jgi:hypothetical protein